MDNNGAWPCLPSLYILWLRWGLWSGHSVGSWLGRLRLVEPSHC